MSALVLTIFAAILIIGGISVYSVFQYQTINQQEQLELKGFLKKQIIASSGWGAIILGAIFGLIAYFVNEDTKTYFESNSITLSGGHGAMIYIGIILFGLITFVFTTALLWILYLNKLEGKPRKIIKIIMLSSIVFIILFFLLFEEGLAPYLQYPLANQILFSSDGVTLVHSNGKASGEGFSFSIAFYALFIILGAVLVLYITDYMTYKLYGEHGLLTTCFFIAFPCGIIGARAWYVMGEWSNYASDPITALYIWDGGLAIMGGAIFGVIVGVTYMIIKKIKNEKYKKLDYFLLADIIIPCILIAQGIGRIGNFLNNEVHGSAVDVSYFAWLPTFIKNNMRYSSAGSTLSADQIYVPLFFIEALINIAGYFFIEFGIRNMFGLNKYLKKDLHASGSLGGWYIAWYGTTRAILEPMRYSSYNMGTDGNWSLVSAYWMIGIGLFIVAIFVALKILKEKGIITLPWDKYKENIIFEENNGNMTNTFDTIKGKKSIDQNEQSKED